jgi:hypothetical protein
MKTRLHHHAVQELALGPTQPHGDMARRKLQRVGDIGTRCLFEHPERDDVALHVARAVHAAEQGDELLCLAEQLVARRDRRR